MNPLDGLSDKIEMTEKEVSDLEYRAIEIIQHLKYTCKYIFYWKKMFDNSTLSLTLICTIANISMFIFNNYHKGIFICKRVLFSY